MTLSLYDQKGEILAQWQLLNAWPTRVMVNPYPVQSTLEVTNPEDVVEVLTLTCEGIQRLQ